MDKKLFNKSSNFFKKEGFYVVLFICLCIVATVAVVTSRVNKQVKKPPVTNHAAVSDKNKNVAKASENQTTEYQGALQVKKSTSADNTAQKNANTASQQVSKTMDTKFTKPVDGTLARVYSEDPVWWDSTEKWRPNFGIDIKTDLGKPVFAVMDGKVEAINTNSEDGVEVVINHQNGLKTVYSNLDPTLKVTKGQTVKKGAEIGKVGKTTVRAAYEKYGNHLHFAVMKGKDYVDPAKYIKY